jgi:hypothetical protein
MKKVIICIFVFLIGSIGYGGTIDPNTPEHKYVEYAEAFKYVYKISGEYADKDSTQFYASAVIIDPEWILTAAHVVNNAKYGYISQAGSEDRRLIARFIKHPEFVQNNFGYYDIALCKLEKKLLLDFYPDLYVDQDETNKVCAISGFGDTGNFTKGVFVSDGKKRAGSNIIDGVDRHLLICTPSLVYKRTNLEFLIASGDSGGGLFIGNKLAGINSCVIAGDKKTDSSYSDEGGHTRISVFVEWIKNTIKSER